MPEFKYAFLTLVLVGLAVMASCKERDRDRDEEQGAASKAGASQMATQKPAEKPDADEDEEGEEGPATPAGSPKRNLLHRNQPANSSFTTSTVIRPDSCLRSFTPPRLAEAHQKSGL